MLQYIIFVVIYVTHIYIYIHTTVCVIRASTCLPKRWLSCPAAAWVQQKRVPYFSTRWMLFYQLQLKCAFKLSGCMVGVYS